VQFKGLLTIVGIGGLAVRLEAAHQLAEFFG
jgi:hypothetical protein